MGRFLIIFAFAAWLMSCGCSKPIEPAKLVGQYEASSAIGTETLELKPGGEYVLRFTDTNGVVSTQKGHWKFEPFEGEPQVALENFSSRLPNFPSSPGGRESVVLLGIDRSWSGVRLIANYDREEYYSKR